MSLAVLFALDVVAIVVLVFAVYFPRHRHREMVVAYLGVNVGVLGVTQALSGADVNAGLGLGLFAVLSIIRLRSAETDQSEIAYFFGALTLGLLGGFEVTPRWVSPLLMLAIVATLFLGDHPRLFGRYRQQFMTLDRAYTDEAELRRYLEGLLGARVHRVGVRAVDLVRDTTRVDVRFEVVDPIRPPAGAPHPEPGGREQ